MKCRFGFVVAVGVGLFGQAALAQQPLPPPPPPPPPAAPPSDKPPTEQPPASPPDKPADTPPPPTDQADPNAQPTPKPAEPTPNAPPAPPPPGETTTAPPVPPPVTLPPYLTGGSQPMPVIPPPAPTPSMATVPPPPGPGADAGVTPKKREAYLRWRGSGINWNHAATTSLLGLGADYTSGNLQAYMQSVAATFNYFLIEPKDEKGNKRGYQLRVQTSLGFDVELTDGPTTKKREPQFRDIPVSVVYSKPLWKGADDASISLNLNGTFTLPTSPASRGQSIYFGVNPRASLFFNVPLRGKDAPFLKSVFLGVGTQYNHRFSEAETPVNPDLRWEKLTTTGARADQLGGGASINSNNFRGSAFAFFSEKLLGGDFWASVSFGATYQLLNKFESDPNGCDLLADTGCVTAQRSDNPRIARVITDFGIALNYFPNADWGIGLGYDNQEDQLGENGQWRNPLYSPSAQFSASVIVSVDSIVERLQGSIRDEPVIYFGQNKKKPAPRQARSVEAVF